MPATADENVVHGAKIDARTDARASTRWQGSNTLYSYRNYDDDGGKMIMHWNPESARASFHHSIITLRRPTHVKKPLLNHTPPPDPSRIEAAFIVSTVPT